MSIGIILQKDCEMCVHNKICSLLKDYKEYCDKINNSVADGKYDKFSYSTTCKYYESRRNTSCN